MHKILDQNSWLQKYKDDEFNEIVERICKRHKIDCKKIEKIHCLENALFKIDDKIVKIYNPLVLSKQKQLAEVMGCERANKLNLPVPKILYTGVIEDEDDIYYTVMECIDGIDLKKQTISKEKMVELSLILKDFLNRYNTPPTSYDLKIFRTDCNKFKFELISKKLANDLKNFYNELSFEQVCYVHADLHKANILLDKNKEFKIIDFGDVKIAPRVVELPPIICSLYNFNSKLIENTFEVPSDTLKDELLKGFVLNDFGTDYMQDMCDFLQFGNIKKIKNITQLKSLIDAAFKKGYCT